jgi:prepilin-type N-terminal cleavage/methylation domain-containing protein
MRNRQSGFTLVEIAIVLVIIGLLLGGVLKGQELINSAKAKNMIGDFRTTSTFVYAYQDRFRALPGDDLGAVAHVNASAAATAISGSAVGDGRINGNWNSQTKTDESYLFWEQVRRAGLASGTTDINSTDYAPRNADGGRLGITGDKVLTADVWPGTFFVCSAGIQGRIARQIDTTMDDGNTTTGTVRVLGTSAGGELATSASAYEVKVADDATLFTVCVAY